MSGTAPLFFMFLIAVAMPGTVQFPDSTTKHQPQNRTNTQAAAAY
jgi:hypothetical protein